MTEAGTSFAGSRAVGVGGGGCPVVGAANQMPASPNHALPGQTKPLSTWRQVSSIPTGSAVAALPAHQVEAAAAAGCPVAHGAPAPGSAGSCPAPHAASAPDTPTWVYPSEQMFYNAMRRKGWTPSEDDMSAVVAIHNAVNERAWREVLAWEAAHAEESAAGGGPQLVKFSGRPRDVSPKARFLNALGYGLPFDRHDWVVERGDRRVRYVIDFYNAAPSPTAPAAVHLDVRPALDSPAALWDRIRMQFRWASSGRWLRE